MKKIFIMLVCLCCVLFGCTQNPEIPTSESEQETQFNTISSLAYIGGSVVYNPTNSAVAQLNTGAIIAVYHGRVIPKNVVAQIYKNGVENSTTRNVNSVTVDKDSNSYGYLKVGTISSESISFEYHLFSKDGKKSIKKFNLSNGDTGDLNNDGKVDIKYIPLIPIRTGFEGAMCLEFVSNQEEEYTTMYAPIKEETLSRSARVFDDYDNTTFYGINSNGSFIYIVGEDDSNLYSRSLLDQSDLEGVSHGDYIINSETGEISAVVGDVPENDNEKDDSTVEKELSLKNSNEYIELDEVELQDFFTYLYRRNQFADEENGPQALLRVLPKELILSDIDVNNCTAEEAIDELFYILTNGSIVEILVEANGETLSEEDRDYSDYVLDKYIHSIFPEDIYQEIKNNWEDTDKVQEIIYENWNNISYQGKEDEIKSAYMNLVAMNRLCIERYYKESPCAAVKVPDVSSVYPMMSLNISEIPTELNDLPESRSVIPENQLNSEYKEFLNKKQIIDEEFDKFYSVSLSSIKVKNIKDDADHSTEEKDVSNEKPEKGKDKNDSEKDEGKKFSPDSFRSEIKLGITGSFESRSGYIQSSLASAIYASFDGNFREFSKSVTLYEKKLVDEDTTFMIGPIPITIGFAGNIGLDIESEFLTKVNYAIEFVGMYGAGAKLELDYGFRNILNPFSFYVDPTFDTYAISKTEYYAGPVTTDNDSSSGSAYGGQVVLKPFIVVSPSLKLGPKYTYVGVNVPLALSLKGGFGLYNESVNLGDKWFMVKENIVNDYSLFGKLGLGASIGVKPVMGIKIPGIGKRIETKFETIPIAKAEYYFDKNRNFQITGTFIWQE